MGILYAKDGKIFCSDYMEIYVPMMYFEDNIAENKGSSVESLGLVYTRSFAGGEEGPIKMINLPVKTNFMVYSFKYETIKIHDRSLDVMTLEYLKNSYVLHQTIPNGREVAESFLVTILAGKIPRTVDYTRIIDMWWRNLEISGVSFKVPSKIFEMIIATIYRNPNNPKERFGQMYGRSSNPDPYNYKTDNVRGVVKNLSTFSGMVFEDIGTMITNGIVNSANNIEEQESPLEKIIYY